MIGERKPRKGLPRAIPATAMVAFLVAVASAFAPCGLAGCDPTPMVGDTDLEREMADLIATLRSEWDPRLYVLEVAAHAADGVVTLTGDIDRVKHGEFMEKVRSVRGLGRVSDELRTLPDPALGGDTGGLVSIAVANLGDAPGRNTGNHLVTQARLGDPLELLLERDSWYLVRMLDDGYLGWLDSGSFVRMTPADRDAYLDGGQALITARSAPIREGLPGGGSLDKPAVLMTPVMGTVLPVSGPGGASGAGSGDAPRPGGEAGASPPDFAVRLPTGEIGYISSTDVRLIDSALAVFASRGTAAEIIALAETFTGTPYLWGGTTSHGFDCSGFIQFVFAMNGWKLPRDADMQYKCGIPVEGRPALGPGDLVFWSTYKAGPSHVGLYIGDGRYIHCGGSSGVTCNSFDPEAPDYSQKLDQAYIGARRILGTGQ